MIEKLLAVLLPKDRLAVEDCYMDEILDYQKRLARLHLEVESEVVAVHEMMFVTATPGRYVGNGKEVRWTVR